MSLAFGFLSNKATPTHLQISWFLGVILGAIIATVFIEKIKLRVINCIASTLVVVNGIAIISAGENVTDIIIARYCDGIAFGLTLIPAIVVGSEISVKRFRGYILSIEQLGLVAGVNIYLIFPRNSWTHGILALICAAFALVFNFIYTIESPVSYLRRGNETEAINALRQLQGLTILTTETYDLLNENKRLLEEDIARGRIVNFSTGMIPMVKMCLFRAFVSMSLSLPLVRGSIVTSVLTNPDGDIWMIYTFSTIRLIGVSIAVFTLDILGRKSVSAISLFIGGGLLIGIGSLFSSYLNLADLRTLNTALGLLLAYQALAGLVASASTCYLGEAFSISVKACFILIAVIFENIIQIIICCAFSGTLESVAGYGYTLGVLQIAFAIFFFFGMPETKQTTLREALAKFTKVENTGNRV